MNTPAKPLPAADPATREYWEAARRGELRLPRCVDCGRFHFYPRTLCPHCGGVNLEWQPGSGYGEVYSLTIVQRAPSPAFENDVPYVVAVIALDEGPHLMSNVVNISPQLVRIGQRVRIGFRSVGEGEALPVFEPDY